MSTEINTKYSKGTRKYFEKKRYIETCLRYLLIKICDQLGDSNDEHLIRLPGLEGN